MKIEKGIPFPKWTRTKDNVAGSIKKLRTGESLSFETPTEKLNSVRSNFGKYLKRNRIRAKISDFVIGKDTVKENNIRIWKR